MRDEHISKSKEDYLEAILIQINKYGACRATDIAAQLGFSKPSVSVALKKLEDDGYVERKEWRIVLTEAGRNIAKKTFDKHSFFVRWFMYMGINKKVAEEEACQIEHIISEESFDKIVEFVKEVDADI